MRLRPLLLLLAVLVLGAWLLAILGWTAPWAPAPPPPFARDAAGASSTSAALILDRRGERRAERNASRALLLSPQGEVLGEWQHPHLQLAESLALTRRCLWSANSAIIKGAHLKRSFPEGITESVSCIDRETGEARVIRLPGLYPQGASVTGDGRGIIVGSGTSNELVRIDESGAVIRRQYADGLWSTVKGGQGRFLHGDGWYAQLTGHLDRTALRVVDERTLAPRAVVEVPGLTLTSVLPGSPLRLAGYDGSKKTRLLEVDGDFQVVERRRLPCGDRVGGAFFAAHGQELLGLSAEGRSAVACGLDGSSRVAARFARGTFSVVLRGETLFTAGDTAAHLQDLKGQGRTVRLGGQLDGVW
ncbi:hypothetical protein F8S09_15220 [Deinococcus sp. SDU3-2]|uniref:Uncharacterized protein n=1 Tax=Deinococcus terrestris TaxID=2651870 RepID=A0A7X1TSM5_9DEIO|nr:hypothetical protein [Deinococcus terrestris]MPY68008.1 hypothetical protein [Deinococcus terrestris]